jgi:hypothetical protein
MPLDARIGVAAPDRLLPPGRDDALVPPLGAVSGQAGPGSVDYSGELGGSAVGITPDQRAKARVRC